MLRKLLLAATAAIALTTSASAADPTVLSETGYWIAATGKNNSGDDICYIYTNIKRPRNVTGFLMINVMDQQTTMLTMKMSNWSAKPGKAYGTAIVRIGHRTWMAQSYGDSNGDAFNLILQGKDFWSAFMYGDKISVQFPQDGGELSLWGSKEASTTLGRCILATNKENPFGDTAPTTSGNSGGSNPFGSI